MQALPADYWLPNGLAKHTLPRPAALIEVDKVLDVGAGLRPMQWYKPRRHVCMEPHEPYADRLESAGYEVIRARAQDCMMDADAIYLLDVIEHMSKEDGLLVIRDALQFALVQVVIFTPHGFMVQDEDLWECGGDFWQTHRSGWLPQEFEGYSIERYGKGFFATWTRTLSSSQHGI